MLLNELLCVLLSLVNEPDDNYSIAAPVRVLEFLNDVAVCAQGHLVDLFNDLGDVLISNTTRIGFDVNRP